jgi:NAD(P)-dependent dehydrogenase (short-subunit alcohol dehydrogenase family)
MHTTSLPRSRTVLVTGAGKRLGREIALTLARAGWQVAVHHRHSRSDAEQTAADCTAAHPQGAPAMVCHADLSLQASVRDLVPAVVAQFGALDAVVNSASTFEHDSAHTVNADSLQTHWMANTAAPVLLAQALHQHVVARGGQDGVVVNLLDQKLWNPNPDFFSYTLSKAALESANTLMAQAFAPRMRVVGVAPGLTLTSHMLSDEKFA